MTSHHSDCEGDCPVCMHIFHVRMRRLAELDSWLDEDADRALDDELYATREWEGATADQLREYQ